MKTETHFLRDPGVTDHFHRELIKLKLLLRSHGKFKKLAEVQKLERKWEYSGRTDVPTLIDAVLFGWLDLATNDGVRHFMVLFYRDIVGMTWPEAKEAASAALEGTRAHGGAKTMDRAYNDVERKLPPERKRPPTGRIKRGWPPP